jgi:hypothetical protein
MRRRAPKPFVPEVTQAIALGMPKCRNCQGRNVRPSKPAGWRDKVWAWAGFTPYRCRACQHRFYERRRAE